jgi:pyruvate kinase
MDAKTQSTWDRNRFDPLIGELLQIRNEMLEIENRFTPKIAGLVGTNRNSARNLLHYLALRRRDIRPLQIALASCGLSSLGRSESRVLANLDAVLKVVSAMTGREWSPPTVNSNVLSTGKMVLESNTAALLGSKPPNRGRAYHGDHAERGRLRLWTDPRSCQKRHGLYAHQLRAR